jgi:hypothetical protein
MFSSIPLALHSETSVSVWHGLKPYLPQYSLANNHPIADFKWLGPKHVILLSKTSIFVKSLSEDSKRPFTGVVPSGLDFSVQGEFSFVND